MNNLSDFDDEMICFLHFVINVYYLCSSDFKTDLEVKMKKI